MRCSGSGHGQRRSISRPRREAVPLLERIAAGGAVAEHVALVVAHPDDETLGIGSRLGGLARLKMIHLTDGSPRRLDDARRAGFADRAAYAAARRRELDGALRALHVHTAERIAYDHPDQEAIEHLDEIVDRLADDLAEVDAVITHPYEHGHPDHDTAALAVTLALRRLAAAGRGVPDRLECASYHLRQGRIALGVFWPDAQRPERRIELDERALDGKRAAMVCHVTQSGTFADFPLTPERLRPAPDYDFAAPAPPRDCVYDLFGWDMTSERWRAAAAIAWRRVDEGEGGRSWHAATTASAGR